MGCEQEQRLLASHAASDRVHAARGDPQPRERMLDDRGHSGEVHDLAGVTPRVQLETPALPVGVDDGEAAERRQVPPASRVLLWLDAAAVRRDHEWKRRIVMRAVPARKHDDRAAPQPVVRDVADRQPAHEVDAPAERCASSRFATTPPHARGSRAAPPSRAAARRRTLQELPTTRGPRPPASLRALPSCSQHVPGGVNEN